MRKKIFTLSMVLLCAVLLAVTGCADKKANSGRTALVAANNAPEIKVTFIELGSVNCIPCKMMQPVMKQIETQYGGQVKVVFHDVWTDAGKPYGAEFQIQAIPTQVFLDADGKEYFRHVGFFPFADVDKILKQKGVK